MRWLGPLRRTLDKGMGAVLEIGDVAMGEGEERDTSPIVVSWEGMGSSMWSKLALEALKA